MGGPAMGRRLRLDRLASVVADTFFDTLSANDSGVPSFIAASNNGSEPTSNRHNTPAGGRVVDQRRGGVATGLWENLLLISHAHKLIYLKTMKTASTSVELFFQKYCVPPDIECQIEVSTDEIISEYGIVGARLGPKKLGKKTIWKNHMPGSEVRRLVGQNIWNKYYKFCVVRNPFDRVVSFWWFKLDLSTRKNLASLPFAIIRSRFKEDIGKSEFRWPIDRHIYEIDGVPCVDDFIRYEKLEDDIVRICKTLKMDCDLSRISKLKSSFRSRRENFSLYYDGDSEQMVRDKFSKEISFFGYGLDNAPKVEVSREVNRKRSD
ncbi:MAG: sulfotransferase family protein [Gammaproteobacteria bacterium]|nr:sulfotransferase family protein [Gammaproteobacteria bacterium]